MRLLSVLVSVIISLPFLSVDCVSLSTTPPPELPLPFLAFLGSVDFARDPDSIGVSGPASSEDVVIPFGTVEPPSPAAFKALAEGPADVASPEGVVAVMGANAPALVGEVLAVVGVVGFSTTTGIAELEDPLLEGLTGFTLSNADDPEDPEPPDDPDPEDPIAFSYAAAPPNAFASLALVPPPV